ncbi:MAG: methyltransferase family protein [Terracidiphilus sp.]
MTEVNRRALIGLIRLFVSLLVLVFLPAWTLHYWQGWMCLSVFFASALGISVYLARNNPALLARRIKAGAKAETEKTQKVIQSFAAIAFVALFVLSALDHRFGWSRVPLAAEIAGDLLLALGFVFVFWVFKVNSFTSGVIEVAPGQQVITSGPYAIVRHPMYLGSLGMLVGVPLSLGSFWGLLTIIFMAAVIILRLLDEERFLVMNLTGYGAYLRRVRYRLVPFVW